MLPLLALSWLLAQAPAAQPNRPAPRPQDDTVASAALGRTMKYR